MDHSFDLIITLTIGLSLASLLGSLAHRVGLPAILGYLLAGYVISPNSPGYVAETKVAEQLAEIGVILMLFSVGMHFKFEDLLRVKKIAITGAIIQTALTTVAAVYLMTWLGSSVESGIILGIAIGVASTVVMARVLSDNRLLDTPQGHLAIGWLVVEDIFTVAVLILLPLFASSLEADNLSLLSVLVPIAFVLAKFCILAIVMFTIGFKVVSYALTKIARLRSPELFTLGVLSLILLIASSAAFVFGTSLALGAFIAGMVIGKTKVKHQAAANALPLKDVFTIIFFLSVGLLFNPEVIIKEPLFFTGVLAIVILLKSIIAFIIVVAFKAPLQAALTVAIALAQIGEFSFILAEEAYSLHLLGDDAYDIIVGCALISISLNPILFQLLNRFKDPSLRGGLFGWFSKKLSSNAQEEKCIYDNVLSQVQPTVVIVGYGVIGKEVAHHLSENAFLPVIVEQNIDTVFHSEIEHTHALFGDATHADILKSAGVEHASLLVITIPDITSTTHIIEEARHLNPSLEILARVQNIQDQPCVKDLPAQYICCEKEAAKTFAREAEKLLQTFKV